MFGSLSRCTLPETNSNFAPENGPKRPKKERRKYSFAIYFQGRRAVSFREGKFVVKILQMFKESTSR